MIDAGMDVGSALRLTAAVSAGEALDVVAEQEADRLLAIAESLGSAVRRPVSRAALGALVVAQLAFNDDSPRKAALYARIGQQLEALAGEDPDHYENVEIPFGEALLRGLLVTPAGVAHPHTVILFGGLNGWGAAYLSVAESLATAGLATLLVELPGQGTARLLSGLTGGLPTVAGISASIDWIEAEPRLGNRAGVWGNSYGGLFSALAAAGDSRVAAACVNGAPARPSVPPFRTLQELMFSFFGAQTVEGLTAQLVPLTFADRGLAIECPLLVLHGGADPVARSEDQRPFFEAATGERVWQEWADGEHTMYNHATERNAFAAGWFARELQAN
jgi:alpha-beta hydrolase superfamily lysophospholipase